MFIIWFSAALVLAIGGSTCGVCDGRWRWLQRQQQATLPKTMKRKKIIRQLALGQIRAQRQGASMHTQLTGISPTLHRHFTDTSPTLLRNSLKFQKIQENSKKFWKIPKFAKILGNFEQNREIRKIRRNFRNCENFRKFLEISINPGNFPASPPHRHFTDTSPTFHRHFTDISPTLHRHFTDISPTFHRHFTDISPTLSENSLKFRKIPENSGKFEKSQKFSTIIGKSENFLEFAKISNKNRQIFRILEICLHLSIS